MDHSKWMAIVLPKLKHYKLDIDLYIGFLHLSYSHIFNLSYLSIERLNPKNC